jgi:hypothetical protein
MHGVAPQMCRQAARLLLGGGAGGRTLGFASTGARVAYRQSKMINWLQEMAGWAPITFAWLVTASVGTTIYFFPIARMLDSLAE